mgnify:CR=1 FL=1
MQRSDFHYDLPEELIASQPRATRSASRLLCLDRGDGAVTHRRFAYLPDLLRRGDRLVLNTYGRSTGFCIDPIEKKPLNHFLPGTPVFSFGTAGCNLACKFCQK